MYGCHGSAHEVKGGGGLADSRLHYVSHCLTDEGTSHSLGLCIGPCFVEVEGMGNEVHNFS